MSRVVSLGGMALAFALPLGLAPGCSLQNQDGPMVTCADLECGRINACEDGIIAQCADGETVRYHACEADDADLCGEDWQIEGAFRCVEEQTDCEGCRPDRIEGCGFDDHGPG